MEKRNPLKIYESENQQIVSLSDGKIPPQAIDLEEAVIGAMLIDEKGVNEVIDILSPDIFYKKSHQLIFESIQRLFRESEPIDLLTVSADIKKNKNFEIVGGDFYLINLSQKVSSSAHIEYHSRIIQQKYIQRKLISISNEIIQKSYNESTDVLDLLDEAESKLYDIAQNNIKGSSETAQNLVIQAKNRIEEIGNREGSLSGISTGFEKLDRLSADIKRETTAIKKGCERDIRLIDDRLRILEKKMWSIAGALAVISVTISPIGQRIFVKLLTPTANTSMMTREYLLSNGPDRQQIHRARIHKII